MSTLDASAGTPRAADMPRAGTRRLAAGGLLAGLLTPAMAIVLLAIGLLALFTPLWVHFALAASGGASWLGSPALAYQLSDRTIAELLLGPATFAFSGPGGAPFYTSGEAAHLRDVRLVLYAFLGLAGAASAIIGWSLARRGSEPAVWRAMARGGLLLVGLLVVLGLTAALAFGAAFEAFHRILFPGGNWAFPADSNLIRLYPLAFWQLSAAALGALGIGLGAVTWVLARRRAQRLDGRA